MENIFFASDPIIYTTGAFLKPMRVTNGKGKEIWFWYISEFNEDSFKDGELNNPIEFGDSKEELLINTTAEVNQPIYHKSPP